MKKWLLCLATLLVLHGHSNAEAAAKLPPEKEHNYQPIDFETIEFIIADDKSTWKVLKKEPLSLLTKGFYRADARENTGEQGKVFFEINESGVLTGLMWGYIGKTLCYEVLLNDGRMVYNEEYRENGVKLRRTDRLVEPDTLSIETTYDEAGKPQEEVAAMKNGHHIITTFLEDGSREVRECDEIGLVIEKNVFDAEGNLKSHYSIPADNMTGH